MTDAPGPTTDVRWAAHTDPDFLALQVASVEQRLAMRALLGLRGFETVVATDDLDLRPARGCSLTRTGPGAAELLVLVSTRVGATRIRLVDLEPEWLARVVGAGQAAIMLVDSAVRHDGTTDREFLRRDVEAGDVLAALVPTDDATV